MGAITNADRFPLLEGDNLQRVDPLKEKTENLLCPNQKLATSLDFS